MALAVEAASVLLHVPVFKSCSTESVLSRRLEVGIDGFAQLLVPSALLHQVSCQQGTQQETGIVVAVIDASLVIGREAPGNKAIRGI